MKAISSTGTALAFLIVLSVFSVNATYAAASGRRDGSQTGAVDKSTKSLSSGPLNQDLKASDVRQNSDRETAVEARELAKTRRPGGGNPKKEKQRGDTQPKRQPGSKNTAKKHRQSGRQL